METKLSGMFYPACLSSIARFSRGFPLCMKGINLVMMSVDRYMNIINKVLYKICNKNIPDVHHHLVTLIFIMRVLFYTLLKTDLDKTQKVKLYIALSIYIIILIATGDALNVALLRKVKQKNKRIVCRTSTQIKFNENNSRHRCYPCNFVFTINNHFCHIGTH